MAPSIIARIKSMIPLDIPVFNNVDKNLTSKEKNTICENDKDEEIRVYSRNAKSAIFPPIENWNNDSEENLTNNDDPNRVF